jgi:plasmid stabilization system protein ParE
MTYDVRLTIKAEGQLKAAAKWWSEHRSHEQAERWYDGFLKKLESLAKHPARCPLAREKSCLADRDS